MPRPKGPATRFLSIEDRGTSGPKRWRVRVLVDGRPSAEGFATEAQARRWLEAFERDVAAQAGPTVGDLISAWIADRAAHGLSIGGRRHLYYEIYVRRCLDDVLEEPVAVLTGTAVDDGYRKACEGKAGASAKLYLAVLKVFGRWLVEDKRLLRENPAKGMKVRGTVKRGKPQIETRRELLAFDAQAVKRAQAGDRAALGVLLGLHLGMRSGEVRALEPRHVDLDRTLRVPGTKTRAARRPVLVASNEVWALLEQAAKGGGRLVPVKEHTLVKRVRELARAAGVANAEQLVFHSLRGIAASLATEEGAAFSAIARGLGHESYATTAGHYATPASRQAAADRQRFTVLQGGKGGT